MTEAFAATSDSYHRVQTPLSFATAPELWTQGLRLLQSGEDELVFDLAGVEHTDSAGLALLIDWLAQAHRLGRTLRYSRCPPDLLALAQLSEVQELLDPPAPSGSDGA